MTTPDPTPEVPGSIPASLVNSPELQELLRHQPLSAPAPEEQFIAPPAVEPAPAPVAGVPVPGMGLPEPEPVEDTAAEEIIYASAEPQTEQLYKLAGQLSAEQIITGDPQQFAHLDDKLVDLLNKVQNDLVSSKLSDKLVEARTNMRLKAQIAEEIDRTALRHLMSARLTGKTDTQTLVAMVTNEILGLGPLEPLWLDPTITEVIVNGPNDVYVERRGKLVRATGARFRSQEHLLDICQRILSPLNRKLDVKDPLADGRLPDGSRVNGVHYAIAPKGPLLTIRRFPQVNRSLVDLTGMGAMTEDMACTLAWLVRNKASTLICGGTGTGKTTMLNALSAAIPRYERVVTIEDSLELRLHPESHVAAMEARPADAAGQNAVPIRQLVKNALRMRPDRIIVGEIRDQAALDMLQACNTGHEGSMSTVHANGPSEAVARLAVMVAQGGEIPADKVDWLVGSALDLIVMIRRYKDGSRRISGIYEVPESVPGEQLKPIPLWEWTRTGELEDGTLIGEYQQVHELSHELRDKLGLDFEPVPSFTELEAWVAA